eukprot:IDg5774t1
MNCSSCARELIKLRWHAAERTLFLVKGLLEDVAIDLLGPFQKTPRRNTHLLGIADRYSKLARTVPMGTIKAWELAQAFLRHWVFTYGPPSTLLSDNGPLFDSKFMQA